MSTTQAETTRRKYGTFEGVFVPTLLTILGVIMYLRAGWVVGNAGLGGALLIILLAFGITGATGLSMSAVTTNIRIGAGGAYSIIARSLGMEVGGSIGIPLFLSQTLAVAMYVFGFREGWAFIFPDHPALLVDLVTFALLVTIAFISAKFAFQIQFVILALIVGSLISIAVAAFQGSMNEPITWFGEYPGEPPNFRGSDFWIVFAVFFPAATGIMAGANLSGELENPRRSIPVGTMAAIGVSFVVYVLLAFWLAASATQEELVSNFTIMIDESAWAPAVLAGLLGATFSSGLSSILGAPRILAALGEGRVIPGGRWLAKTGNSGEPRRAMAVSAVIAVGALMLRDLNAVAPLITMFFLITYAMLNVVVLVEQRLGLVSFRPLLRVPQVVPLLGLVGCLFAMFIVNPAFSLVAVAVVILFYFYLVRRRLRAPFGDVRSGLFVALAEWAAKRVSRLDVSDERAWKPNLLIPVADVRELRGTFHLLRAITYPKGSLKILGFTTEAEDEPSVTRLERITEAFKEEEVFASWGFVRDDRVGPGFVTAMETLRTAFFQPNIAFLTLPPEPIRKGDVEMIMEEAPELGLGVVLFGDHPRARLGRRHFINVWFPDDELGGSLRSGTGDVGGMDLAILLAVKLQRNWDGRIRLLGAVSDQDEKETALAYLAEVAELARIPRSESYVMVGDQSEALRSAPQADVSIFRAEPGTTTAEADSLIQVTGGACLLVRDAGGESAIA